MKKTLLGMPAARRPKEEGLPTGVSPSGIPQDLAAGRVATPMPDSAKRPSLDMDWDDEELATQVYDKPSDVLGMGYNEGPSAGPSMAPSNPAARQSDGVGGNPSTQPPLSPSAAPSALMQNNSGLTAPGPSTLGPPSEPARSFEAPSKPLSEPTAYSPSSAKAHRNTRRRGKGGFIFASILIILLVAGAVGWFFWNTTRPGRISGSISPATAQVLLGDDLVEVRANGRFSISGVRPGTYIVAYRADGYEPQTETIEVEAGGVVPLAETLVKMQPVAHPPLAKTGVAVLVEPAGAEIYINNYKRNEITPSQFIELPPGQYNVRVQKQDYLSLNDAVTVTEGTVVSISKQLQPEYITVNLSLEPSKARCYLSQSGQKNQRVRDSFKVMPHRSPELECTARGFEPQKTPIKAPEDGSLIAKVTVALSEHVVRHSNHVRPPIKNNSIRPPNPPVKPPDPPDLPPGDGTGYLSVNTTPWTKVYVDGRFIKNTPMMHHKLKAGNHRLTLINGEFNIHKTVSVHIKTNENTPVILRNLGQ